MVADFGIALAVQQAGTARMTQTGLSLGTPQYMSPEQAMGERTIDARSDVYALGAITYEMLTGEPPFTGATVQAIIARILSEEARPLSPQRKSVPPHVEAAVLRALEKVPADRFASAAEFALALHDASRANTRPRARRRSRRSLALAATALAAVAAVAAVVSIAAAAGWRLRAAARGSELPALTARITADAAAPSDLRDIALSPDGTVLAYVSSGAFDGGRLWLRSMSDGKVRPLPETEGARWPFWAPDGSAIGYYAAGALRAVSVASGAVRVLAPAPNPAPGAAWGHDGTILFVPFYDGLWQLSASGGAPKRFAGAAKLDREPSFLPDGRHFLYSRSGEGDGTLMLGDLKTGEVRQLATKISNPKYVEPGYVFFFQASAQEELSQPAPLFVQRFDADRLALAGEPVILGGRVDRPYQSSVMSATRDYLVIGEGPAPTDARAHDAVFWMDRATGRATPVNGGGPTWTFRIAHDGRRVLFGGIGLWLHDPVRDVSVRVPTKAAAPWPPLWSPDDRAVAVTNGPTMSIVSLDGRTEERALKASDDVSWADPVDWGSDGAIYYVREPSSERPHRELWRIEAATNLKEHVPTGPGNVYDARLSPDAKWIAWESDASGRHEVYLGPAAGSATPVRVSKTGGGSPRWRTDGRELFFMGGDGRIAVVGVTLAAQPAIGEQHPISTAVVHREPFGRDPFLNTRFDVSPTGDRFLVQTPPDMGMYSLTLVQGWRARLQR